MTYNEFKKEILSKKPKILKATLFLNLTCIKESAYNFWENFKCMLYYFLAFISNIITLVFLPITYLYVRIARKKIINEDRQKTIQNN